MKIRMLEPARDEFYAAVHYYNEQREGLGFEFVLEIKETLFRISEFPAAWPKFSKRTRRCLVNRFPFALLYQKKPAEIVIVAVMHMSRHPGYWKMGEG